MTSTFLPVSDDIQAHGEQPTLPGVLQSEKDPRSVHALSQRRVAPTPRRAEAPRPQPGPPAGRPRAPAGAPAPVPPVGALPEHLVRQRGQRERGRQPAAPLPGRRPRADEA
jgi:hypothetical protein